MVKTKEKAPRRGNNTTTKATQSTSNRSGRATSSNGQLKTNGRAARAKTNKVQPPKTKTHASPKPSTKGSSKAQSTAIQKGANKTPIKAQTTVANKSKTYGKQNAHSKNVDKAPVIHRLINSLRNVSDKKKKEEKYDNYYPGQLRPVNNAETRGHIGYTVTKKGTGKDAELGYVSITHSSITQDKDNTPLITNPNPKDLNKSYAVNKPKQEKAKKFGKTMESWRLNKRDKKTIKKIYHKK